MYIHVYLINFSEKEERHFSDTSITHIEWQCKRRDECSRMLLDLARIHELYYRTDDSTVK